ncbi:3-hydroxyacyl-CoA dehydrogenase NAD-binding domain-containing protein [Oricola cellulosilytica]|uniref:3-hydroxyacyl-CoA dehydrogenase n=1 Tax=Oricola cellulosilytica TaxID=1429082 RepID=A0A4R0PEI3_9HYPH|nr:3-hydroxyacyl-CoA dehydrogenase NAD-binding domain-containing protein [Oricola cellulosilytica]TCD14959.1 3-hydroxyacyl-CoA dehydrogenase [Oricola cellulosilytica]
MTAPVSVTVDENIAYVTIDNPPVNALSQAVRAGLSDAVRRLDADDAVQAVVLLCTGRTFVAGADIREFGKPPQPPHLPDVIAEIENAHVPWVAAIHGTALGGGLELALGCSARVVEAGAKLGLPEVSLGLIPGAGGTVRLPRLVPVEEAIAMITSGKPVDAAQAVSIGLADRIAKNDRVEEAAELARELAANGKPDTLSARPPVGNPDETFWAKQRASIKAKVRGQISPVAGLEAVRDAVTMPAAGAFTAERARFMALKDTEQSAALRYMFFAERNTGRPDAIKNEKPAEIRSVGVIGGGTMGAGIAASFLLAGLPITLIERDAEAVDQAIGRVKGILEQSRKRGVLTDETLAETLVRFSAETSYETLSDCDLVIEAVFEDMNVKHAVFADLDKVCRADAILATNTSYLDVSAIADATSDPSRVVGLHFFSPAHVMKLLEIVKTEAASPKTLETALSVAKMLHKIPVIAGVCDGFIGNRIFSAFRRECDFMLEEGALPEQIDAAMRGFGFAMGIYAVQDLAGLDIGWATRKRQAASRDPEARYSRIADRICELGRFGQKTGAGWYSYAEGSRTGDPDPLVERIVREESERLGIQRKDFSDEDIMNRIMAAMQTEARAVLDEGIALKPSDIDVTLVHGYGFPRHQGGPMFKAGQT